MESIASSDPINNPKQTAAGYSVLEMVNAFEKATGQKVPYELSDRRPGDVASAYASTDLAEKELGWKSKLGIEDMCKSRFQNWTHTHTSSLKYTLFVGRDMWTWQSKNAKGYKRDQKQ